MGHLKLLILSCDEVGDLQEAIAAVPRQLVDADRMMKLMLQMLGARADNPVQYVLLNESCFGFTHPRNYEADLQYAGPAEWSSYSGWLYVVGRDPGDPEAFTLLADMVRAWCVTFPEVCSPELAAAMGH